VASDVPDRTEPRGGSRFGSASRRRGRVLSVVTPLLLLAGIGGAQCWTGGARTRILRDAVRLMPLSLRTVMEANERELLAGMIEPMAAEDQPEHWQHPAGDYGSAAAQAQREATRLIGAVDEHEPLRAVVRRFGTLAHWVEDVNNPLHTADRDGALSLYYADYQRFLEQQLDRFPLAFHGYRSARLASDGPRAYLLESAERSRQYAAAVRRGYGADGRRLSAQAFDERSLPFGVGSLSFSHAVNDIVRVWLWAWEASHGDVSGTPYPLDPPGPQPSRADSLPSAARP